MPPLAAIRERCGKRSGKYRAAEQFSISRRQFVQLGALGGLLTMIAVRVAPARRRRTGPRSDRRIFIVQQGGPSHIDTWDMKPEAPLEIRGPLRSIPTTVPGTQVCELLPRLAARADKYCLLRTLCHTSNDHDAGMHMFLTGRSVPAADAPYLGSIASRLHPATRNFPSYVWIQELEFQGSASARYTSGGHLGPAQAPFLIGRGTENFANRGRFQVSWLSTRPRGSASSGCWPAGACSIRLSSGNDLGRLRSQTINAAVRKPHQNFHERAFDLVSGPAARQAFDLSRERVEVRDRYGRHPLGQNLLAARRLIEAGARLVSVNAFTGFEPSTKWPPVVNVVGHGTHSGAAQKSGTFSARTRTACPGVCRGSTRRFRHCWTTSTSGACWRRH